MALDRERQVVARHALAVVAHAHESPAAPVGHDLDVLGAGIEGVLDEFLDDARRPLDHLARGDAVDDGFGQLANGHAGTPRDEIRCESRALYCRIEASRRVASLQSSGKANSRKAQSPGGHWA